MATQSSLNKMVEDLLAKYKSAEARLIPTLQLPEDVKRAKQEVLEMFCDTFMLKFERALQQHDIAIRRHAKEIPNVSAE